ncbi:hypothetical protein [Thalassococcus sp. S3]|uniref:hypothetical protein n=1 Tax=Thalassococcus sp. S3 TaxID=2017482 RepID=UPI0010247D52|nr:hypothetical protein [Thalassococcus sp. S3]QBF29667.1 hypothetical protein CFI11_00355 [Thalassococcus sp. S3]
MTLHLDPRTLVSGEFGCLEPAQPEWLDQYDYWEDFNARFFQSNGAEYHPDRHSNVQSWLTAPDRAPYAAMADVLLTELQGRADLGDVDLVLMAHWMPDVHLGTSVTNFALHKLGLENGFGFAISDRGRSAPLFALQCAARYLRDGRKKALLMVMDQKHLLYRSDVVDAVQPSNSGSVMVLEAAGQGGLAYVGYERRTGIGAADTARTVAEICTEYGLDRAAVTVIADPDLTEALAKDGPVRQQTPRKLCSAPFAALAEAGSTIGNVMLLTRDADEVSAVLFRNAEGVV